MQFFADWPQCFWRCLTNIETLCIDALLPMFFKRLKNSGKLKKSNVTELGKQKRYHRSPGVKTTEKQFWTNIPKISKMSKILYVSTLKLGVGWVSKKGTEHHTCGIFFGKPWVRVQQKLWSQVSNSKFKNLQNLINVSTLKLWGWLGFFFFKNSRNTCDIFLESPGYEYIIKMMIPGVKLKNVLQNLINVSTFKFWGWVFFF